MQYIQTSKDSIITIKNRLKQSTYQPVYTCQYLKYELAPYKHYLPISTLQPNTLKKLSTQSKYASLYLIGAVTLLLPTKSLIGNPSVTAMEKVVMTQTLTVAATPDGTFIDDNGHQHGFGYDAAARYADTLGVNLNLKVYSTKEDALKALNSGDVEFMIDKLSSDQDGVNHLDVSCNAIQADKLGLKDTGLIIKKQNTILFNSTKNYLCDPNTRDETLTMAKFYQTNLLNDYSVMHFNEALSQRLPRYETAIKKVADKYGHDWQLLTAIGYQESHLNPTATSPTGVQGIMMLTRDTAEQMGITDRTDAIQSIQGGAKYLQYLKQEFEYIPTSDRLWFVLAAYNMGPNAVKSIQTDIAKIGENPNLWSNFYTYLSDNSDNNSRYSQCIHYVTNIRTYFEYLKSDKPSTQNSSSSKNS